MGIGEVAPTLGQCIHVRSDRLGVPTHEAHPVIEVIDGNEQDIGFGGIFGQGAKYKQRKEKNGEFHKLEVSHLTAKSWIIPGFPVFILFLGFMSIRAFKIDSIHIDVFGFTGVAVQSEIDDAAVIAEVLRHAASSD